jgi:hypothetical protein
MHYLSESLLLTSKHSYIRVVGMPGEKAVVSGGVELNVSWKPYNVTPAPPPGPPPPPPSPGAWVTQLNYNYVWVRSNPTHNCDPTQRPAPRAISQTNAPVTFVVKDMDFNTPPCELLGKPTSAAACAQLCQTKAGCHAWTWHDKSTGPEFKFDCVGRSDGQYV